VTRRLFRALAALAALILAGWAAAQCTPGPDTSQVTVPDFLAVYYQEFRSLPDSDEARFYGGVCVTAVGGEWTVIADEVVVTGLSGRLGLRADSPELFWGDLRMTAEHLAATTETLVLQQAAVTAPDFSGEADTIALDLVGGGMALTGFTLAGVAFAVSGDNAQLVGETLSVAGPELTTCIGLEEAPYAIEGESATVDLGTRTVDLRGGILRVGALRVGLRPRIQITEETMERFTLPVRVQNVPDRGDPSRPGSGVGVRVVGLPVGDEGTASLDLGATGVDPGHRLGAVALVRLAAEQAGQSVEATVGLEAGQPLLDVGVTQGLTPWLAAQVGFHSGAELDAVPYHEGRLGLSAEVEVPLPAPTTLALSAEAFAAATALAAPQDPATPTVFGPRVGGAVGLEASTGRTAAGTFAVGARAEATLYPRQDALQWGVRLSPSWRLEAGPLTLSVAYDTRLTNAASPFDGLDRLEPLARTTGSARLEGELHRWDAVRRLSGFLGVEATHDAVPVGGSPAGLSTAVAETGLRYATGDWAFEAAAEAQFAGVLDPSPERDAAVTYSLEARRSGWPVVQVGSAGPIEPYGAFSVRAEAVQGLVPADLGLRHLELSMAVPFAFENLELRPAIGFDFAPLVVDGDMPVLSLHALDLTVITCCGSLTVGYANERGSLTASFSIDLERRPPPAGEPAAPSEEPAPEAPPAPPEDEPPSGVP
jgi:hypothetical protein